VNYTALYMTDDSVFCQFSFVSASIRIHLLSTDVETKHHSSFNLITFSIWNILNLHTPFATFTVFVQYPEAQIVSCDFLDCSNWLQ